MVTQPGPHFWIQTSIYLFCIGGDPSPVFMGLL
jgi:hypothetical protein